MTTTFPKRGSNPDHCFQPFCLEQPQQQSKSHIKRIGPFILITLIVGLILLLPQGEEDISIVVPPSSKEWTSSGAENLILTQDGGFALVGYTESHSVGRNDNIYVQDSDMWLVKTDANGVAQWNQTYGSTGNERGHALVQTIDGGFALVGYTESIHAGNEDEDMVYKDMWLVKTDASGIVTWYRTYGSKSGDEVGNAVIQTIDGGYVLGGEKDSLRYGTACRWLVKNDASGMMIWNQIYGGTEPDEVKDLVQTIDGGFVLVGDAERSESGVLQSSNLWLVKTNAHGIILWNQTYKGADLNITTRVTGNAVIQTVDGGFALVGSISSIGKGYESHYMWLVKTDANGVMIWNQTYGGTHVDGGDDLVQTIDGGFALLGSTSSFGPVRTLSFGVRTTNVWLVKTDANGVAQWNQTYGNTGNDVGNALVQTIDGGFALAGYMESIDAGGEGMWLVKTNAKGMIQWHQIYRESTTPTTPTSGWRPVSLLDAAVVLTTWYKKLE